MWHVWWTEETHREFWWGNLRKIVLLEGQGIDVRKILKWIIKMWDRAWIGLIWLRIGTDDGLL